MPRVIGKYQVVAVTSGVDINVFRLGVFCAKNLPQLIEDIAGNAVADVFGDRLDFPVKSLAGGTVRLAGGKLDGVVAVSEMVDKLNQNARFYALTNRDEPE